MAPRVRQYSVEFLRLAVVKIEKRNLKICVDTVRNRRTFHGASVIQT